MNLVEVKRTCTSSPLALYVEFLARKKIPPSFSLYHSHIWVSSKSTFVSDTPHHLSTCPAQHWNKGQLCILVVLSPRQIFVREKALTSLFP